MNKSNWHKAPATIEAWKILLAEIEKADEWVVDQWGDRIHLHGNQLLSGDGACTPVYYLRIPTPPMGNELP